jgi:hypothetical protein
MVLLAIAAGPASVLQAAPLPLTNHKSGISVSLSGTNGIDWAVETSYHNEAIADQTIYLKSSVNISLAHNSNNTIAADTGWAASNHVLGTNVPPGAPNCGEIRYKIDRDQQCHRYTTANGTMPSYAVLYSTPFNFSSLTYDGSKSVLGSIGNNGGPYGTKPQFTTNRFCYGMLDAFSNEWHVLTYWDNDNPLLAYEGAATGARGQGSDGYCVPVCVNPLTPIIQLSASGAAQYYTTPLKTYFIPKIWDRTTYLTTGVQINFVNLTNGSAVQYRVDGGVWQTYAGTSLASELLFSGSNTTHLLEAKCGASGTVLERTIVFNPSFPAPTEQHGYLLWSNETERQAVSNKVNNVQPFKISYQNYFRSDGFRQGSTSNYYNFNDQRGVWRYLANQAANTLQNAFVVAIEGPTTAAGSNDVWLAKQRLLWMSRLEPVGFENDIGEPTPAKDYLSELGQTEEQWTDAAVAYDLMAGYYRNSQYPGGITPVEEFYIRDSLAKVAKSLLQFRDNYDATSGSGNTHWAHGYELSIAAAALAMPTYKTPYYGVSGGDRQATNDLLDATGKYWNPLPDQGVTWYAAATDPWISRPGYPNNVYTFRSNYQITDDGWWSGPNDLVGGPAGGSLGNTSDRTVTGPMGGRIVDIHYSSMANAEVRVELIEMGGYEAPFTHRIGVVDLMRRIRGDTNQAGCVTSYLRRRMVNGYVGLTWDSVNFIYTPDAQRIDDSLVTFNHNYEFASLPAATNLVGKYLRDLRAYYGFGGAIDQATSNLLTTTKTALYDAYALALCDDISTIPPHPPEPNHPPIIKPLFKYVVRPGEACVKYVIAIDPDGDPLTVTATNLPAGATWNPSTRVISWYPTASNALVRIANVTATDGTNTVSRPFPMILKPDAGSGPIPGSIPAGVTALIVTNPTRSVTLTWSATTNAVAAYLIYRDGVLWGATASNVTSYTDADLIYASSKTRYNVSLLTTNGAESAATDAFPLILEIPANPTGSATTDSVGDGIPDAWRAQYFGGNGRTTNASSCATCDADGTGQNNLFKFQAGLNPTNPASVFRIASTTPTGSDYVVTWQTAGPRTNFVQATNGGGYNTNFQNISEPIIISATGDATTNYTDVGGATNYPARFYRIHLSLP